MTYPAGLLRDILIGVIDHGLVHERVTVHTAIRDGEHTHMLIDLYEADAYDFGDLSWLEADCLWVAFRKRMLRSMWLLANDSRDGPPQRPTEQDVLLVARIIARDAEADATPEAVEWRKKYIRPMT